MGVGWGSKLKHTGWGTLKTSAVVGYLFSNIITFPFYDYSIRMSALLTHSMLRENIWHVRPSGFYQNRVSSDFPLESSVRPDNAASSGSHGRSNGYCELFIDREAKNKEYFGGSFFKQSGAPKAKHAKERKLHKELPTRSSLHYSKSDQLPIKRLQSLHSQRLTFYRSMRDTIDHRLTKGIISTNRTKLRFPALPLAERHNNLQCESPSLESDYSSRVHHHKN